MDNGKSEYFFFWFIENYSFCWHKNGERLVSPNFTIDELEGTVWKLELCPRGDDVEDKGHISLFLIRRFDRGIQENISIKYELSFLAANGSAFWRKKTEDEFKRCYGYGYPRILKMDKILSERNSDYLPNDILTVRCKIWRGEGNSRKIGQSSARTRIKVEKYSFIHAIERFSTLQPNVKLATTIPSHSNNGRFIKSNLHVTEENMIMIEIVPADSNQILCKCEFSLLDDSGGILECGKSDNRCDSARKSILTLPLSLTREDVLNKRGEYLPDDKLSLICECTFSSGIESQTVEETLNEVPLALMQHKNRNIIYETKEEEEKPTFPNGLEEMKALYINGCLTDVEVRTGTKSFPAHKVVLCARSPVFKTMLTTDMKEKDTNCIQVDDLKDEIVQQLLLFMYSDRSENLQWESATQLYYAADKYQIGKLREVCSSFMVENLTTHNVVDLLLLADTHSDNSLRKSAEDFIFEHEEQVYCSKEWEMLMKTNPWFVVKTMQSKYKRKREMNFLEPWRKKGRFL